jgi:hypothetical protein
LSVSDPSIKRKKIVLNVSLLDIFITNGVLLYTSILVPSMFYIFLAMVPIMTVVILFTYILLRSVLGRSFYPVIIYSNGIEFPDFLFNRLAKRPIFLRREDIESAWVRGFSGEGRPEMKGFVTLGFKTRRGKLNDTGARNRAEVESAIEWMERNWGLTVERKDAFSAAATPSNARVAHKVAVQTVYCPQCGRPSDEGFSFCPQCGASFKGPLSLEAEASKTEGNISPAPSYDPYRRGPSDQHTEPSFGCTTPAYQNGKSPKKAFLLGLGLGFFGLMGMGHIYMDKVRRGVALLIIGGFLAFVSLYSWIISLEMTEYSIGIRVFTALVMSTPYLILQLWQSFDAPKPKKDRTKGKY